MADYFSLNVCVMVGMLGKDPEILIGNESHNKRASFPFGTREIMREGKIKTDWIRVIAWGKLADFCQRYLSNGSKVVVVGRIQKSSWAGKDGGPRTQVQVRAERIITLEKSCDSEEVTEADERDIAEQEPY